jgi:hypothetical protein
VGLNTAKITNVCLLVKCEVLTAVLLKHPFFWDVTPDDTSRHIPQDCYLQDLGIL